MQDLKFALRTLLQKPGFTLIAIFALALAIGASTAMFSVVNAVILKPLTFDDSERVAVVLESAPKLHFDTFATAPANFVDWSSQAKSFETMAAFQRTQFTLTVVDAAAERVPGALVSGDYFKLVRTPALIGRTLLPADAATGKGKIAVVSYGFWNHRLGKDAAVTHRTLLLGGESYDIVGVMPERFMFPSNTEIWTPLNLTGDQPRGAHFLTTLGRLRAGSSLESAGAEMRKIASDLEKAYPPTNEGWTTKVFDLHGQIIKDLRQSLYILLGAVGFVLLIACANVANLLLARGADRAREIAVRFAMGARRGRLIRQLLTESVILSLAGGLAGIVFAYLALSTFVAMAPPNLPRIQETTLDRSVLGFALLISLTTGIVFGIVPALQVSRTNLNSTLKDAARGSSAGAGSHRIRQLLVVGEVALTIVVLIGAGLLIESVGKLLGVNPGFDPQHVLTAQFNLPGVRYKTPEAQTAFMDRVLERLSALPGVTQAASNSILPLSGGGFVISYSIKGRELPPQDQPSAAMRFISPDYFSVVKTQMIKGRAFTAQDRANSQPVIIINETLAKREFPNEEPIGRQMVIGYSNGPDSPPRTIVGVVKDMKITAINGETDAQYYVPAAQLPFQGVGLALRTAGDPAKLISQLRNAMKELDPNIAVFNIRPFEEIISISIAQSRFNATLLAAFAGIAVLLACIGVYGVMSYSVNQRTHEIGIRMALGQDRSSVLKMILMQALALSSIGVIAGVAGAFALTRLMAKLLFNVNPADPLTFISVALSLVIVALTAGYLPARRATQVDPLIALRYE